MTHNSIYKQLLDTFGPKCFFCGEIDAPLNLHHLIPLSEGGETSIENWSDAVGRLQALFTRAVP